MKQIFIVGASSPYGVGAESTGWGDLVKQYMHSQMYRQDGVGEKCEVYNFTKPGATIDFVVNTLPSQLKDFGRDAEITIIASVGGNNSKAENTPDNFVSTEDEYRAEMESLLEQLTESSDNLIIVSNTYVDESKTNPKTNPFTGGSSFFTNERRGAFNQITRELCDAKQVPFVAVSQTVEEWIEKYQYEDVLHPNQAGHQQILEAIKPHLPSLENEADGS